MKSRYKIFVLGLLFIVLYAEASFEFNSKLSVSYPSGNLINNGSFEIQNDKNSWSKSLNVVPADAIKSIYGEFVGGGAFQFNATSGNEFVTSNYFKLKPNKTYTLIFYFRTGILSLPSNFISPTIKTYSKKAESFLTNDLSSGKVGLGYKSSTGWKRYVHVFTTNLNSKYGRLSLIQKMTGATGTAGAIYFDEVYLAEGNLKDNAKNLSSPLPEAFESHLVNDIKGPDKISRNRAFFNGSNKVLQTVVESGMSNIVTQNIYDAGGRISKISLPIGVSSNNVSFVDCITGGELKNYKGVNCTKDILTDHYNGTVLPMANGFAYSKVNYSNDLLAREISDHKPGLAWQTKFTKKTYGNLGEHFGINGNYYFGQITNFEDANGNESRETYDKLGQVIRKSNKLSSTKWVENNLNYDANGNVIRSKIGDNTSTYDYSSLNQVKSETTPQSGKTEFIYDAMGRVRFTQSANQINPSGDNYFNYVKYDNHGREYDLGVVHYDPSKTNFFHQDYAHDRYFPNQGNFTQVTGGGYDLIVWNEYDRRPDINNYCEIGGDFALVVSADGTGDDVELFTSVNTAYDYLKKEVLSLGGFPGIATIYQLYSSTQNEVNPVIGNKFNTIVVNGHITKVRIKGMTVVEYNASESIALKIGSYKGRLSRTLNINVKLNKELGYANRAVMTFFNYDRFGRVIHEIEYNGYVNDPKKQCQISEKEYNQTGILTSLKVCDGVDCENPITHEYYEYDNHGNLLRILNKNKNELVSHLYDPIGRLKEMEIFNGIVSSNNAVKVGYSYNIQGDMISVAVNKSDVLKSLIYKEELFYENLSPEIYSNQKDYEGNITKTIETYGAESSGGAPVISSITNNYKYDAMYRLYKNKRNLVDNEYLYLDDGRLNKVTRNGKSATYIYNTSDLRLNRLQGPDDFIAGRKMNVFNNFVYDGSGNRIFDKSKSGPNGGLEIKYNHNKLPYKITYNDGTNLIEEYMIYLNGGRTNKIKFKNRDVTNGTNLTPIFITSYYHTSQELQENLENNTYKEIFDLAGVARYIKINGVNNNLKIEMYLKNHLSSTVGTYNPTEGKLVYALNYLPYGKIEEEKELSGFSDVGVTPKFTGKETDKGIDLTYFGSRYYDSDIGLWISPDAARVNHDLYAYANNNPVSFIDPDGNEPNKSQTTNPTKLTSYLKSTSGSNARAKLSVVGTYSTLGGANAKNKRYLYTEKAGWIDLVHFFNVAKELDNLKGVESAGAWLAGGWPLWSKTKEIENKQEAGGSVGTAWSYEDAPSNFYGWIFWKFYYDPKGNLSDQMQSFMDSYGGTLPENAPNWNQMWEKENPYKQQSPQNKSFKPMFTK